MFWRPPLFLRAGVERNASMEYISTNFLWRRCWAYLAFGGPHISIKRGNEKRRILWDTITQKSGKDTKNETCFVDVPYFIKKFHIWLLRHCYPSNITYKFQPVLSVRFDWKYLQYVLTLVFRRLLTVWKLLDFYVIQILREIKFGEFKRSKNSKNRSFKTSRLSKIDFT